MTIERRILSSSLEVRADGETQQIVGHAAVFNRDSELIFGSFIERIAPGAFAETISKPDDVRALINHDPNLILGRNLSKTLTLREDEQGLHVTIDPPNTSYAQDLLESTKRGDISQMSFGFQTMVDQWERGKDGAPDVRTLIKVRLFDVSPVTFPAYPDTDVAVRSHEAFKAQAIVHEPEDTEIRKRRNELEAVA
jgi:HK97 family phage prohead protease